MPDDVKQVVADVAVITELKGFFAALFDQSLELTNWALDETAPEGPMTIEQAAERVAEVLDELKKLSKELRRLPAESAAESLGLPAILAQSVGRLIAALPVGYEELLTVAALAIRVTGAVLQAQLAVEPSPLLEVDPEPDPPLPDDALNVARGARLEARGLGAPSGERLEAPPAERLRYPPKGRLDEPKAGTDPLGPALA